MSSSYQIFLEDDAGRRIANLGLVPNYSFFSYTRAVAGFGTIQFGLPYQYYKEMVPDVFRPDWRLDVWRSPEEGFPMRREGSFLLRKYVIYERVDGMETIEFYGRSPIDILRRADACYLTTSLYDKTGKADDVMVAIVGDALAQGRLIVPTGEFSSDVSPGLGPTVTLSFQGENLLDVLNDIRKDTAVQNMASSSKKKIYFDVVEYNTLSNGGYGYIFRTFADLRGKDRTASGLIFSSPNGNIRKPTYYEDRLDQITVAGGIYGASPGGADCDLVSLDEAYASRWNTIKRSLFFGDGSNNYRQARTELAKNSVQKVFSADFLNTPGGPDQPRSLYGVDWDFGDVVRAEFADKAFDCEIKIVYVSMNEKGVENVIGSSEVNQ